MRLGDTSCTRLKVCLLVGSAAGCLVYAGVLLRRRLHKSGPPPIVQCPFADNTVALLRDLHDGPFRFGDPTPIAAAARKEAMRRIRRQQAHRRRLRHKMRLAIFHSQVDPQSQHRSCKSGLQQASLTTKTGARNDADHPTVASEGDATPLAPKEADGVDWKRSGRGTTENFNYEGRFVEQHRRLQEEIQKMQQQQQRGASSAMADTATDSMKPFVKHARAMFSTPVDGALGAAPSLTSSFTESDTWDLHGADWHRRPRSWCSRTSSSSSSSSFTCASSSTSSSSASPSSGFEYYSATSTSSPSSSSCVTTASLPTSAREDAASVATAESAAAHEELVWSAVDLSGAPPGGATIGSPRNCSNLSHPTDSALPPPRRRTSVSSSHAASTLTSGSPPPPRSYCTGGGGGTTSMPHRTHRHSHPLQQSPSQYLFEATTASSHHHHHFHSTSQSGAYAQAKSAPEGAFASSVTTNNNTTTNVVGRGGEEAYNYPISAALYGPPLFATEMDVTDALAELRSSACYSAERQCGSSPGSANPTNGSLFTSNSSNNANYSGVSNAGSSPGGGGSNNITSTSTSIAAANLLGGALTLSAAGQSPSMSASSQGLGASSYLYHSQSTHHHHHHSLGHGSSGQGDTATAIHSHHRRRTTSPSHQRSSSSGGGAGNNNSNGGPYLCVSSSNSQWHSHTGSPFNSQLLSVYTTLPGMGNHNTGTSPLPSTTANGSIVVGGPTAVPMANTSTTTHPHGGAGATAVMAASFYSAGEGISMPRWSTSGLRKWWRRTRRHIRRRAHDWKVAMEDRAKTGWGATRCACIFLQQSCAHSVKTLSQLVYMRTSSFANVRARRVLSRLRRASTLPLSFASQHRQGSGSAAHEVDLSAPLSKRVTPDTVMGTPGSSPLHPGAAAAATTSTTAEADARKSELDEQASLDANSMEEAINKVVEMLAPSPGRVPTVVVIRAPLGYDVSNDADSLWTALHLDSTSFEEGLVDVVMMEELKTEPLPPAPLSQQAAAQAAADQPSSVPSDAVDVQSGTNRGEELNGNGHIDGVGDAAAKKTAGIPPHILNSDADFDASDDLQRQSAHGPNLPHSVPRPPCESTDSSFSDERTRRPRPSTPQASQTDKKADLRVSFELYPAHIFYSSIIRAAILQEKDLALRRAAAELYGGSADLDGSGNNSGGGCGGGYPMDSLNTAVGGSGGGGVHGSPSSPLKLVRAASASVLGAAQRNATSCCNGHGTSGTKNITNNVLSTRENCCLSPIVPCHFLRAPNSPKLSEMHRSPSSPTPGFSHHYHHSGNSTVTMNGASNDAHYSSNRTQHNEMPLLPLPPPSVPLAPSFAAVAAAGAAGGVASSPASLSPILMPSMQGPASNVVVRLSPSYSFPALPPQMVLSPLQSAQVASPHSARGVPHTLSSVGASVPNAHGSACGCGTSISTQSQMAFGRTDNADRYCAARRFVNRSEVLLYIHVLRAVVPDGPAAAATALPSCVISDLGEEGGIDILGDGTAASLGSSKQRTMGHMLEGETASPNTNMCTAKPPSTRRSASNTGKLNRSDDQTDVMGKDTSEDGNEDMEDVDDSEEEDSNFDGRDEEAQTLLELRQREIEAPVLLRYRLRICRQGKRSLEALKRTEKYAQDHVQVWQDEAKKMLQAMPPTDTAVTISSVTSGQGLSFVSTPSLIMTSSPVLRPADAASVRLPPPAQRLMQRANSRFSGLPPPSVKTGSLASHQELGRANNRNNGPLRLPAWAMEVLIRRESMRETLIRDLKEKAFRICAVPLPDMRVHCILPPVVPRYTVAHARGFQLSRTFAEEVLSQQRTLQYILLQREQENQRVIAAEIRRAMRRQERRTKRRQERRLREEERRRQKLEKKGQNLTTRLTKSMNPATIVSRMASLVKLSGGKDLHPLNSTGKIDVDDMAPITSGQTTIETAGPPSSTGNHGDFKPEVRSNSVQQHCRHCDRARGNLNEVPASPYPTTTPTTFDSRGGGYVTSRSVENNSTVSTTTTTTEIEMHAMDGGAEQSAFSHQRQRPPPSASPLPPTPQPLRPEVCFPQSHKASSKTWTHPAEHDVHHSYLSSQNSTPITSPREQVMSTTHTTTTATTNTGTNTGAGSNVSGTSPGNIAGVFTGLLNTMLPSSSPENTSGKKILRGLRWGDTPPALLAPASVPPMDSPAAAPNSSRSSLSPLSLCWPMQSPLSQANSHPQPGSTNNNHSSIATAGAGISGGCTSPPPGLHASRSSYWTAVHTATNANASVTPPPLLSAESGAGVLHISEDIGGLSSPVHYATNSSTDLNTLKNGTDSQRPFLSTSLEAANKTGSSMDSHSVSRPGSPALVVGVEGGRRSPSASTNTCGPAALPLPPPPPLQVLQASQSRAPALGESYHDGAPSITTSEPSRIATTATPTTRNVGKVTSGPYSVGHPVGTVTRDTGVMPAGTPPGPSFPGLQNTAGMKPNVSPSLQGGTALLVPTNRASDAEGCPFIPSSDSSTVLPLPIDGGLPASSISSAPPAVPNNSMYGTFDAYFGHSSTTPQAVLLRQQAQVAAVAGLTSGNGGGVSPPSSLSSTVPSHRGRSPANTALTAAVGSCPTSSRAATSSGSTSGAVNTSGSCGDSGATVNVSTTTNSVEGGCATAGKSGSSSKRRLSPLPQKSKPCTHAPHHNTTTTVSPPSTSQHLQVFVAASGSSGSTVYHGSRPTSTGLLPYNYSADSVSSMYGTAHYPLYQYLDDTVTGGGGMSSSANTYSSVFASANTLPPIAGGNVSSDGTLAGLANTASATAICTSAYSAFGNAHSGGGHSNCYLHHGRGGGGRSASASCSPQGMDFPIDVSVSMTGAMLPNVIQDTYMNRLKQYNKLLSDLLGAAGGPMRSGISFYYTYGDATALLYNASIQTPSDEDILELLAQQPWTPLTSAQEMMAVGWNEPHEGVGSHDGSAGFSVPIISVESASDSGQSIGRGANGAHTTTTTATNGNGSITIFTDSAASSANPSLPAPRTPPTLAGIGDSPPALPPPVRPSSDASSSINTATTGKGGSSTSAAAQSSSANGGISSTSKNGPHYNGLENGLTGAAHEEEGCSYLDYGDMPYPEDTMDALEVEQIDAQRTRNKKFYSIFKHLHRAYHDAVFGSRETVHAGPTRASPSHHTNPSDATTTANTTATTAAARHPPPPLGGFTTTASFAGSPSSPSHPTTVHSFTHRSVFHLPYRVYAYTCSLLLWVGWKVGLLTAPARKARCKVSSVDDVAEYVCCGVLSSSPGSFPSSPSSPCSTGGAEEQDDMERLARRFPGERIVTFGKEWRVASHLDMHNGHYGLSPLQVWMAARYSRRFAGEVYLMDVVASGSDPYYPAVRVLDEVVAHAVLYYHNHSLRDFTEDLASELGLEYVPQTVWGRRALGLPIDETEVQKLDGLLYTASRRRQDRHRRQREGQQRQHDRKPTKQQRKSGHNADAGRARPHTSRSPAKHTNDSDQHSTHPANSASKHKDTSGEETLVALEYGNDVDRPTFASKVSSTHTMPRTVDVAGLARGMEEKGEGGHGESVNAEVDEPNLSLSAKDGEEDMQHKKSPTHSLSSMPSTKLSQNAADCNIVAPIMGKFTSFPVDLAANSPVADKTDRCLPISDGGGSNRRHSSTRCHHPHHLGDSSRADPFDGVSENLWIEMQSFDQEEDEEVFYGAAAAAVVGIGSGDINMAPHIYDAVMECEVYEERMLLRELDHLKDFLIENRNVLSSAMLTTTGSNALEAVFGVPATVFPFLLCARESVPLISSIFESLSYHYGALTYDNFSKLTYDAFHMDRPDVLRHTPRLFRMVNKSRRGCITYEELCGWLARKLSCGNNIQPNAHLLAAIMSLRLPLALVAESREDWGNHRCALKSLSDAEDEEY